MAIRSSFPLMFAAMALLSGCGDNAERNVVDGTPADNAAAVAGGEASADQTIAQTLGGSADHSTLVGALRSAGLEATLAGAGSYTLFAPANGAFEKLPAGAVEALMTPEEKARLTAILTYHVVPGVVMAEDLARAVEAANGKAVLATLGGANLTVTNADGALTITDAKGGQARIIGPDMTQSNGVIHSIDTVLMPS